MLKLLNQVPELRSSEEARMGAEIALGLWADSRPRHPYMSFMGTDFRKLKAPLVWYEILHPVDVLSQYPELLGDGRLRDMAEVDQLEGDG